MRLAFDVGPADWAKIITAGTLLLGGVREYYTRPIGQVALYQEQQHVELLASINQRLAACACVEVQP